MKMLTDAQDRVLQEIKGGCFDDDYFDISMSFLRSARCLEKKGILEIETTDKWKDGSPLVTSFSIKNHPPTTALPSFHAWYRTCFFWASRDLRSSIMGTFGFQYPAEEFQRYFESGISAEEAVNLFFHLNELH